MTGDHGGRVVVFRNGALLPSSSDSSLEDSFEMAGSKAIQADRNWVPFFQFQSHDSVFDYLRSKEVSCKVNHLKAIPASPGKLSLLSCNEKTIKAWGTSSCLCVCACLCVCVFCFRGYRDIGATLGEGVGVLKLKLKFAKAKTRSHMRSRSQIKIRSDHKHQT